MKKCMYLLLIFALPVAACGQKIDASKVPAAVTATFAKQYPGIYPKWEKEDGKYEAGFKLDNREVSVLISANGIVEESETEMPVSDLPAAIISYVKAHYPKAIIKGAASISKTDGKFNYEVEIKGKDLLFDKTGNFLKEVKD